MRPERLELEGFTAFRERTVVDFAGADLFALSGPTGAGKSSVVDAICFALYGSVPRYDHVGLVAPLVSVGRAEAKVRLDFSVDGRRYTAVRVVRRTPKGATTKEARLEQGDELLAGDAAAVTAAVEDLLGLGFEELCKCVVLPQGAFARFLHDKPKDRQELLVGLLQLGVYNRVRELAVQRQRRAEERAGSIGERLAGDLAGATDEAVEAAEERVGVLTVLAERVRATEPAIHAARGAEVAALAEAAQAAARADRLAALRVPDDAVGLATDAVAAEAAAGGAERAEEAARVTVEVAEKALAEIGDRTAIERALADHDAHGRLLSRRAALAEARDQARDAAQQTEIQLAAAVALLDDASARLEAARQSNRAAALHRDLTRGAPCPVCRQTVDAVPPYEAPVQLELAQAAVAAARNQLASAEQSARTAGERATKSEAALEVHDHHTAEVASRLAGAPEASALTVSLAAVSAAEDDVARARAGDRSAREQAKRARARLVAARAAADLGWRHLDAARDGVAALEPPPPGRADLGADWHLLVAWAASLGPAERRRADAARAQAEAAAQQVAVIIEGLRTELSVAGLTRPEAAADRGGQSSGPSIAPGWSAGETVAAARATAQSEAVRLAAAVEQAGTLRAELATVAEVAVVARTLALHLKADRFEKWLLDEALQELVDGATGTLYGLSGGAYSLCLDDRREFAVIDHRNADERRPVRTLSGGETFLASLALALALADRVAALATGGAARLESLFLDEGFGTLDPETLDTVAGAIEQLQAGGRMVGIITHVRDLAERVPVRFEVSRGPGGSTIERVLA